MGRLAAREYFNAEWQHALGGQLWRDRFQLDALHLHVDGLERAATVDALVRRDIAVVAPDGHLHEIRADDAVVGWIESDPAAGWEQQLTPRVRLRVAAEPSRVRVHQAAYVSRRDLHR